MVLKSFVYKVLLLFLAGITVFNCSPSRFVKPLNKREHAINVSVGGPLIKYGKAIIPIPFLTAVYGYGLDSTLTLLGGFNITSVLFGNVQGEIGMTKQIVSQKKYIPGISVTPIIHLMYRNTVAKKVYPQLDFHVFWNTNTNKHLTYVGISNWFELASKRAFNEDQPYHWFLSPVIGHQFRSGNWDFNLEAKIISPFVSNENIVVEYKTPFKKNGAFGIYVGCTKRF